MISVIHHYLGAATLYYWYTFKDHVNNCLMWKKKTFDVIVVDIGGGTTDICYCVLTMESIMTIATHGSNQLGGNDIDMKIAEWCMYLGYIQHYH